MTDSGQLNFVNDYMGMVTEKRHFVKGFVK